MESSPGPAEVGTKPATLEGKSKVELIEGALLKNVGGGSCYVVTCYVQTCYVQTCYVQTCYFRPCYLWS
jgi:hypothetical protein